MVERSYPDMATALVEFFRWAMREGPWDSGDLDGGSVQDKAESLGLIVKTQYDAEKHGMQSEFETGDDWFEYAPGLLSVAQGSGDCGAWNEGLAQLRVAMMDMDIWAYNAAKHRISKALNIFEKAIALSSTDCGGGK